MASRSSKSIYRPRPSLPSTSSSKKAVLEKRNSSILNFFQKADGPPKSNQNRITQYIVRREASGLDDERNGTDSLFFEENIPIDHHLHNDESACRSQCPGFSVVNFPDEDGDDERYNENGGSMKRRKTADGPANTDTALQGSQIGDLQGSAAPLRSTQRPVNPTIDAGDASYRRGPFIDESDSEEEDDHLPIFQTEPKTSIPPLSIENDSIVSQMQTNDPTNEIKISGSLNTPSKLNSSPEPVTSSGSSSLVERLVEIPGDIGRVAGVDWDFETPGETWDDCSVDVTDDGGWEASLQPPEDEVAVCPICRTCLHGMTDMEASLHVNNCLDGNPSLPSQPVGETSQRESSSFNLKREERKLLARPPQRNPFDLSSKLSASSAFSKLMAANAEESAWSKAATSEETSRGKQAYERTCPFYKILPGFSICVDAFRYGAVEGCSAYFLSHFHSDHYIGLTSSWGHGKIYCSRVTGNLVRQQLKVDPNLVVDIEWETKFDVPDTHGVRVTMIPANHCPGSSLFLFEKTVGKGKNPKIQRILHCGDFRACPAHIQHPLLRPNLVEPVTGVLKEQTIDVCYLDTTYLNPKYAFPNQEDVIAACAEKCVVLNTGSNASSSSSSKLGHAMTRYLSESNSASDQTSKPEKGRLLIVVGTYSIGKERLCLAIARALRCKIYVSAAKRRICACLEDQELSSLLTTNPLEAQVHMQSLMEIRADTLLEYLTSFKPHFSRIVGFRPTGWNYRPPAGRATDSPAVSSVLYSDSWKARFLVDDLVAQRGSNTESICFSVPYSEHSSFRELTMFCCALRISRVIPTVNVSSRKTREKMKIWIDRWEAEKRKSGLFKVEDGTVSW